MSKNEKIIINTIENAKSRGATTAEAIIFNNSSLSASTRKGKVESIERSESKGLGLRVIINQKQAIASTTNFSNEAIEELIDRTISMANQLPDDPYLNVANKDLFATNLKNLDLYDAKEPTPDLLLNRALETEESAISVKGITNSNGADANYSANHIIYASSNGFINNYQTSSSSISTSVIAGTGSKMQTSYDYSVARHAEDLKSPTQVGRKAAEKALKKLNPKKIASTKCPIIFDPMVARMIIGNFTSAINGTYISSNSSFLRNYLGKQIFKEGVNIIDDPFIIRGLSSRAFDGEGIEGNKKLIIENGELKTWLLDLYTAKKLNMKTTGNATRGISSPPQPSATNFYLENGVTSVNDMIKNVKDGIFVTEMFGRGGNILTGDFSSGISGYKIENGHLTFPINEVTIAGSLKEMFRQLIPANDLELLHNISSPTILIEQMTVAGA